MPRSATFPRIIIIGAGASGICLAIQLKRAGIESFSLLESASDVGGVWHANTYPGAGCDIPAFLYSFSFAPKHDWKRRYARQADVLGYLRDCVDRFGIRKHIEFGSTVKRAELDENNATWRVETADGKTRTSDILISAVGQLNRPRFPEIEGIESFSGPAFHSARWDHGFHYENRDVAVVGSAASAVQILPHLAEKARSVCVFQRSPNWINRFRDTAYPRWVRWVFRQIPGVARLHRCRLFWSHEILFLLYRKATFLNWCQTLWLTWKMRRRIPPPTRPYLIPDYPAGCKRILLSNDYLETLQRVNVELVTDPITRIYAEGIETERRIFRFDGLVFATGFETGQFLGPIEILGRNGRRLHDAWKNRPRASLGMVVPGLPNFFMLYGPNTNLGHNSIIFMVECQVNYIIRCLARMIGNGSRTIEIDAGAAERRDRKLQEALQGKIWTGDCANWYRNETGVIVTNWGSSTVAYWLKTRRPDFSEFKFAR